ncbi:IS256 family transposase [Streptacidiphilus anmyonensis]|uniref:IS256 family transposase n=1 Tax=Streptacidiphilus anmyonensis TaxID=405782 RepID=UPI000694851B|nr:IS256 family transposase [Streptacidiphilus anmyonensis]
MNDPLPGSPAAVPSRRPNPWPGPGRTDAVGLLGCDAPLRELTRLVLEAALQVELDHHLGSEDERARASGRSDVNSHNGHRPKTVLTAFGPVEVLMPRDRKGSFSPAILPKYRRDLCGRESLILSLAARGLPRPDFEARLAELYGASPPAAPLPRVADRVAAHLRLWQRRRLAPRYPLLFADRAAVGTGRAAAERGAVQRGPLGHGVVDLALAVTVDGRRELLGVWAPGAQPRAGSWETAFRELRARGLQQVSIVVGDGTVTLPAAVRAVWPHAALQARTHLIPHAGPGRRLGPAGAQPGRTAPWPSGPGG